MVQNNVGVYLAPKMEVFYLLPEGVLCESIEKEYGCGENENQNYSSPSDLFEIF